MGGVVLDQAVDHALAYSVNDCAQLGVGEVLVQAGRRQPDLPVGVDPIEPGVRKRSRAEAQRPSGIDADHLDYLRAEPLDKRGEQPALAAEVMM